MYIDRISKETNISKEAIGREVLVIVTNQTQDFTRTSILMVRIGIIKIKYYQ